MRLMDTHDKLGEKDVSPRYSSMHLTPGHTVLIMILEPHHLWTRVWLSVVTVCWVDQRSVSHSQSQVAPSHHNVWNLISSTTYPCFPLLSTLTGVDVYCHWSYSMKCRPCGSVLLWLWIVLIMVWWVLRSVVTSSLPHHANMSALSRNKKKLMNTSITHHSSLQREERKLSTGEHGSDIVRRPLRWESKRFISRC